MGPTPPNFMLHALRPFTFQVSTRSTPGSLGAGLPGTAAADVEGAFAVAEFGGAMLLLMGAVMLVVPPLGSMLLPSWHVMLRCALTMLCCSCGSCCPRAISPNKLKTGLCCCCLEEEQGPRGGTISAATVEPLPGV